MKQNYKFSTIITLLSLGLVLPFLGNTFSFKEENRLKNDGVLIEEVYNDNPIFYPASYDTDFTDEPLYNSTQKELTFDYMNMGITSDYYRGESVKVAVIDSGINYDHEDFLKGGQTVVKPNSRTIKQVGSSWYYYNFSTNPDYLDDGHGHGSNVAACIASVLNGVGGAGIAPNVELYVYKVTNASNGYEWTAINSALQYCIDEGIDVINMSFQAYVNSQSYGGQTQPGSGTNLPSIMTEKINACHNAGITMVAAAGNFNTTESSYPAQNNYVISVGSLAKNSTTTKAGFSNYGSGKIDLVAPGYVRVAGVGSNSTYVDTQGTSFSAPLVTGAIALYKQKHPDASPNQIETALKNSCDYITGAEDWAGSGRLNVERFLGLDDGPASITIDNGDMIELDINDTHQIEWTVNPSNCTYNQVAFEVVDGNPDNNVVTVSNTGLITAKSEGTCFVKVYSTYDSDVNNVVAVEVTGSVTPVETYEWRHVTSANDLSIGDEVIFTNKSAGKVNGTLSGTYLTAVDATFTTTDATKDTIEELPNGAVPFTLGKSGNYWTFTNSNSQLLYGNSSNVSFTSSSGYYSTWTIEINNGNATVKANGSYLLSYNGSSPRWKTYSSSQGTYEIFKKTSTDSTKALDHITIANMTTSYDVGDTFSFDGTCTAYWTSDITGTTSEVVTPTSVTSPDMSVAGQKEITVTYTDRYGTKTASYNITVSNVPVSSIALNRSSLSLYTSEDFNLTATVSPSNATNKSIQWTSNSDAIATVSSTGYVSAVAPGTTTITATAKDGSGVYASCTVSVSNKLVSSITLSITSKTIEVGSSFNLSATVAPNDATDKSVTWNNSHSAYVDVTGTGTSRTITALAVGTSTITVSANDASGVSAQCVVTVIDKVVLTGITVSGYTTSVPYMNAYQVGNYTCTASYSDGSSKAVTPTMTGSIDTSILGIQNLTFSYTEENIEKTFIAPVKVTNVGASNNVGEDTEQAVSTTYSFTGATWTATVGSVSANWTSGKDGAGYLNNGVQVTKNGTGANATSPSSYSNISSVVVSYCTNGSSGAGSIEIKVGTNTAQSLSVTNSGGTTARNLTFDNSNISGKTGSINITVKCTSNSIYICGLTVNYTSGYSYPATPEEQAIAYATYFRSITGPYCEATDGGAMEGAVWTDLKAEYNAMVDDAKDEFCRGSSNEIVVDARARYAILVKAYPNLDNFVEDSNKTPLVSRWTPINILNISNNSWIVIVISMVGLLSVCTYLLVRKKKN